MPTVFAFSFELSYSVISIEQGLAVIELSIWYETNNG